MSPAEHLISRLIKIYDLNNFFSVTLADSLVFKMSVYFL